MAEKKERYNVWLTPSLYEKAENVAEQEGLNSVSELVEKAVNFYIGYLNTQSDNEYLPTVLLGAMQGLLSATAQPINRNLFKIATELAVFSNLLATTIDIPLEQITALRGKAVSAVRHINGVIQYEQGAYKTQINSTPKDEVVSDE